MSYNIYTTTINNTSTSTVTSGTNFTTTRNMSGTSTAIGTNGYTFSWNPPSYILQFCDYNGKKVVTIENDGSVTWHDSSKIGEASDLLGAMMTISAEQKAGITARVKSEIFDQVFEEIYQVFKDKKTVSCEELRIAYESSKIFRKLQGSDK